VPSRRTLLAASGTAVTALAGCAALGGGTEGSPANVREHRNLLPSDGSIVARVAAERTGCPRGDVELYAAVVERPTGDLQLVSAVEVRPGERRCESDWRHDGVDVAHSWPDLGAGTEAFVSDTTSNVVYTDDSDPEVQLRTTGNAETGEWRVRRASDDGGIHERYAFRSTYVGADVADGDELAVVTADVLRSAPGLLDAEADTVTRTETLVYGNIEDES